MRVDKELVEMLERPVDIRRLVKKLFFNIDDLEKAALKQPNLYLEAGRFKAQTMMKVASLKRRLGRIVGEKSLKIRQRHSEYKTEGAIKGKLSLDPDVQIAQKKFDNSEVLDMFADQLREAYKERLMVIAVLTKLRASEISSQLRSVKGEAELDKMRKRAQHARKALDELEDFDA